MKQCHALQIDRTAQITDIVFSCLHACIGEFILAILKLCPF